MLVTQKDNPPPTPTPIKIETITPFVHPDPGSIGHPICSYGIIAHIYTTDVRKYLMICRKHTLGYCVVVRGKYASHTSQQLIDAIDRMTIDEKTRILNESFDTNWYHLWNRPAIQSTIDTIEKQTASMKYETNIHHIRECIRISNTSWITPEWEFPKGRINAGEHMMACALREFSEETKISSEHVCLIKNIIPLEEHYISFDNKQYKNIYFLAVMNNTDTTHYNLDNFQEDEVSQMRWFTETECIEHIRSYHVEKKILLHKIASILDDYTII